MLGIKGYFGNELFWSESPMMSRSPFSLLEKLGRKHIPPTFCWVPLVSHFNKVFSEIATPEAFIYGAMWHI